MELTGLFWSVQNENGERIEREKKTQLVSQYFSYCFIQMSVVAFKQQHNNNASYYSESAKHTMNDFIRKRERALAHTQTNKQ